MIKYIPKKYIPSKKVKTLEYIKDDNDRIIGKVCGVFLNTANMEREKLLAELIKAIEKVRDQNDRDIILEDLNAFNLKDIQSIEDNTHLRIRNGMRVKMFFLPPLLKRIYEGLGEDLKEKEILIIGDEENLTKKMIESLYEYVGFITLAGKYETTIEDISSYILNKTGLSIFYSKKIDRLLPNYSIIINLKDYYQLNLDKVRKKALIFDLSIEKPIKRQLAGLGLPICIDDFMFNVEHLNIKENRFIKSPVPSYVYEQFNLVPSDHNKIVGLSIGDKMYNIDSFIEGQVRRKVKL